MVQTATLADWLAAKHRKQLSNGNWELDGVEYSVPENVIEAGDRYEKTEGETGITNPRPAGIFDIGAEASYDTGFSTPSPQLTEEDVKSLWPGPKKVVVSWTPGFMWDGIDRVLYVAEKGLANFWADETEQAASEAKTFFNDFWEDVYGSGFSVDRSEVPPFFLGDIFDVNQIEYEQARFCASLKADTIDGVTYDDYVLQGDVSDGHGTYYVPTSSLADSIGQEWQQALDAMEANYPNWFDNHYGSGFSVTIKS